MTKPPPVCVECGNEILGEALVIGHNADGALHSHPGICDANRREKASDLTVCLQCRRSFNRREGTGPVRVGRNPDYCSSSCRKQRDRLRSRTWRAAAKTDLPKSPELVQARLNELQALADDVQSHRLNGAVLPSARRLLESYAGKLHAHRQALVDQQRREAEQRRAENMKVFLEQRRQADDAAAEQFGRLLDDAAG